jgi:hypothetical protein
LNQRAWKFNSNQHLIPSILMMEVIISSETPVLTRATRRYIPQDGTFQLSVLPVSSEEVKTNLKN